AMDGYVCHEFDVGAASPAHPVRLRVSGEVRMGEPPGEGPDPGEAWSITTGGAMPLRGNRVVPIEWVRRYGDELVMERPAEALRESFKEAAAVSYDVVLSTGGVSVGPHDKVPRTWLDLGVKRIIGRIDLKPGGPFFAGLVGSMWVIGLSGSPAAALATYHLL